MKLNDILSNLSMDVLKNSFELMKPKNLKILYKTKYEKYMYIATTILHARIFIYPIDKIIDLPFWFYISSLPFYFIVKAAYVHLKLVKFKLKYNEFYTVLKGKAYVIKVNTDSEDSFDLFIDKLVIIAKQKYLIIKKINKLRKSKSDKANILLAMKELVNFETKKTNVTGETIYTIYSYIGIKELWKELETIEKVLKSTVIDINYRDYSIYQITIKNIDWKDHARTLNTNKKKFSYVLKRLNCYPSRISSKITNYQEIYKFNCVATPKEMDSNKEFIKHIIKMDFKILSDNEKDFKIVLDKNFKIPSFFETLKNIKLESSKNVLLGFKNNGSPALIDIFSIYHSIVAGGTGKGKSNFGHVFLSSLIKSEFDIVFLLLDTKKSEMKRYRDISNVVYQGDKLKCVELMENVLVELERRNDTFEPSKFTKDIETWNLRNPDNKLPYVVIYIEEISDLILSNDVNIVARFNKVIERLSQVGRSCGYRLILSTQYPKADVITTLIKANCATRFGFGTTNSVGSKLITDNNICVQLPKGVMYYQDCGEETKIYVPHLEDKDIEDLVYYLEDLDQNTSKPLSHKFISFIPNSLKSSDLVIPKTVQAKKSDTNGIKKFTIKDSFDLLELYKRISPDTTVPIMTLVNTLDYVDIGKTKLQDLRKELVNDKYFISKNKNLYWNTKRKKLKLAK